MGESPSDSASSTRRSWGRRNDSRSARCSPAEATSDSARLPPDSLLLGSSAALTRHRERQYEKALSIEAVTDDGIKRKAQVLVQLDGRRLSDADYAFAVVLPLLAIGALQRAFGYFGGEEHRDDMRAIEVFVDREAPPTNDTWRALSHQR
jgi:hypothetical protein